MEVTAGGGEIADTLQWWFSNEGCWRIRTYAIDHDIHVHKIGSSLSTTIELARENNRKHYGDVIKAEHVIYFANCCDRGEVKGELAKLGLRPALTIENGQFAFWQPDEEAYRTKSRPA